MKLFSAVCIGSNCTDDGMIHHYIRHYKNIGVDVCNFYFVIQNNPSNCIEVEKITNILKYYKIENVEVINCKFGTPSYNHMRKKYQDIQTTMSESDWLFYTDIDEFCNIKMEDLIICNENGFNCVSGMLVDRISDNYAPKKVDNDKEISLQYPVSLSPSQVEMMGFGLLKKVFCGKKDILIRNGDHHFIESKCNDIVRYYPKKITAYHYRYDGLFLQRCKVKVSTDCVLSDVYKKGLKEKFLQRFISGESIKDILKIT